MNIAVIGAGAAGLTAAWELAKTGQSVAIIEASDHIGGLASGFQLPGWDWSLEKFYHHWFATDTDVLRFIDELGFGSKVIFSQPRSGFWIDDQCYDLSNPLQLLQLPLSITDKLRMAFAGLYLRFPHRWQQLDHISAYDWLYQMMGEAVYQKLWAAVLEGKFRESYREVPLSWLWAHIYNRTDRIAVYDGGFQALWDDIANLLGTRGVNVLLNTPVDRLSVQDGKVLLTIRGQSRIFDKVVSTLSPQAMLKMTPGLVSTDYARQMLKLKNVGAVCLVLALNQPFLSNGTYSLTLPSNAAGSHGFPFINLYEHTNLVSRDHYGGDHILYCVDYLSPNHAMSQFSDAQIAARFLAALPRLNPDFSEKWIRQSWVFRSPVAQPIPLLNAGRDLPAIKTPLPGLYWITMSQMHPWGKGTNFAVRLGRQAASILLNDSPPL